jgi:cytochrome c oxidase subunit 3
MCATAAALPLPAPPADAAPIDTHPGHRAMWVGICLEFVEFAVFFGVYFTARWYHPQAFQQGASRLWTLGGVLITSIMVTSGWLLTRAVAALQAGRVRAAQAWLAGALLLGLAYPVVKLLEWQWNLAHGLDAGAGIFVVVYYYLTINHFVHSCWGLLGMAWGLARLGSGAYTAANARGMESLAIYWHATDLVWLMIFSLFYAFA